MTLALHRAVRNKRMKNVLFFLDKMHCGIECTDARGRSLFQAACQSDQSIAFLLVERGCKIDAVDDEGLTALHWSAHAGHTKLCKLLIEKGCKVSA